MEKFVVQQIGIIGLGYVGLPVAVSFARTRVPVIGFDVEATPDTIVCCDTGEKMMVKEPMPEVMRRAIEYARTIRKPLTD